MRPVKKVIQNLARRAGLNITRYAPNSIGDDPFLDMQHFLRRCEKPVIFDVGANIGQSSLTFKDTFPASIIHSFEPSPSTYQKLVENCKDVESIKTWNNGVGSQEATLDFFENELSVTSSFLAPSTSSWGKVTGTTQVPVITLDSFAEKNSIDFINLLKSDTQGYDFEVFKGSSQLMKENRIGLIYSEFIFSDLYKGLPKFHDIYRYLSENDFELVAFYGSHFEGELLSWVDALFINRTFNQRRLEQSGASITR